MGERRVLYLVPTLLHLMNCIVTQMTVYKDYPADIVFEDTTDFSQIASRLKTLSIFENIYDWDFHAGRERYRALPTTLQRRQAEHKPSLVFTFPELTHGYSDLCVNIDSYAPKFFYYWMLEKGMRPTVHFISEGTGTYALDFENTRIDRMDHGSFHEKSFLKNIGSAYMYRPELYTGGSELIRPVRLPSYSELPKTVISSLETVFGKAEPVREKVIFFEGAFWGDGMLVDEMKLFLAIADHVGKENIIVKRHPRNRVDRFTPLGYHVMPQQTIPWEIMIKDIDLSQKLLISVASFTCFSAFEMYDRVSYSLLLKDLMHGRVYFLENKGYQRFFQKVEEVFNSKQTVSWSPRSLNELHRALDAISMKIGGFSYDAADH